MLILWSDDSTADAFIDRQSPARSAGGEPGSQLVNAVWCFSPSGRVVGKARGGALTDCYRISGCVYNGPHTVLATCVSPTLLSVSIE